MRDIQQQKVYDAEAAAQAKVFAAGKGARDASPDLAVRAEMRYFEDRAAAQAFADEVCDRLAVGRVKVRFVSDRGKATYRRRTKEIWLPQWARQKFTLLHELAHHMIPGGMPSHGAEFCEAHLLLLRVFLPEQVAREYTDAYLAEGCAVTPSGKQALRFLAYVKRIKSDRLLQIILEDGRTLVGRLVAYERNGSILLGAGSPPEVTHEVASSALRYATWVD